MDTSQTRTLGDLSQATPAELEDALAHWDELDAPSLARLDAHPEHGLRLRVLRAAESWLTAGAPVESEEAGPCPTAETLYEHGRGPGVEGSPLDPQVTAHLERCAPCAALVASLASAPPLPLDWTSPADAELEIDAPEDLPQESPLARARLRIVPDRHDGRAEGPSSSGDPEQAPVMVTARHPRVATWLPLAAAAALLAGVFVVPRLSTDSALSGLPTPSLLRGPESAALFFPRGPVLADAEGTAAPLFELAAVDGASEYRVELFRHEGTAFAEGQRVADLRSGSPTFAATPLPIGAYTWRVFASVDGLERELGALEFEIRSDAELLAGSTTADVEDIVSRVAALHAAGFLTDARAVARTLPDSPEKEAYLLPPGR
jgi:hypothetical protein